MLETKINTKKGFPKKLRMLTWKYKNKIFYCANIFLLIFAVSVSFAHLIQFTGAASEGFVIRELNKKLSELKTENKELSLKAADYQSITAITKRAEELGMIKSEGFDYLTIESNSLSLK